MLNACRRIALFVVIAAAVIQGTGIPASAAAAPASALIDINAAGASSLAELPGVGPVTAQAIIAGRPYGSVDDLAKVKGIGPAKLSALRGLVGVGPGKSAASGQAAPSLPVAPKAPAAIPGKAPSAPGNAVAPSPYAPSVPPVAASAPSSVATSKALPGTKVNVNTCQLADLEALPGIGPVKARKIVEGRPYNAPEDIMKVSGIKEGTFGKIKDLISVK